MDDENEVKRAEIAASLDVLTAKVKEGGIRSMLVFAVDDEGRDFHLLYMEKGSSIAEMRGLATSARQVVTEVTKSQ